MGSGLQSCISQINWSIRFVITLVNFLYSGLPFNDFTSFKSDLKKFIDGKYSQFSLDSKISILDFFGKQDKISDYVEGFLTPEGVHEEYAEKLGVDIECIADIYEVCTAPDLDKETLIDNNHVITQLLKNSSIYLTNK